MKSNHNKYDCSRSGVIDCDIDVPWSVVFTVLGLFWQSRNDSREKSGLQNY